LTTKDVYTEGCCLNKIQAYFALYLREESRAAEGEMITWVCLRKLNS
jgi:hypothetical protein